MEINLGFQSQFGCYVENPSLEVAKAKFGGRFKLEAFESQEAMDRGDSPLWAEEFTNGVVTVGLDDVLNTYFHNTSQSASWYFGLIASGSTLNAGDTMSSHSGWTESTAYSEGNRQQWVNGASSGNVMTNGTPAAFTINANGTNIDGAFLVNNNTKAGSSGTLWATGKFSNTQSLNSGNVLRVTYTVTSSGS